MKRVGTVTVTAERLGGSVGVVSFDYTTRDKAAASVRPLLSTTTSRTTTRWLINGDVSNKTFNVTINDDSIVEEDERFEVAITNTTGNAVVGLAVADVRIQDDDNEIGFVLSPYRVTEADTNVTVTVSRRRGSVGRIVATYGTASSFAEGDVNVGNDTIHGGLRE